MTLSKSNLVTNLVASSVLLISAGGAVAGQGAIPLFPHLQYPSPPAVTKSVTDTAKTCVRIETPSKAKTRVCGNLTERDLAKLKDTLNK